MFTVLGYYITRRKHDKRVNKITLLIQDELISMMPTDVYSKGLKKKQTTAIPL